MPSEAVPFAAIADRPRRISPTDISQFIRLDQCERYLRLRLHAQARDWDFMGELDVAPQEPPPLLSAAGHAFEAGVEEAIARRHPSLNLARDVARSGPRTPDNDRVAQVAQRLAPGEVFILFQPRLEVVVNGWQIRGDIDILRLERDAEGGLRVLIADAKSSTEARIEHRLQVAFYAAMLRRLFEPRGVAVARWDMGILYRGVEHPPAEASGLSPHPVPHGEGAPQLAEQRAQAAALLGVGDGLLEIIPNPDDFLDEVASLVTASDSRAAQIWAAPFDTVPFHLGYKCDGCLYQEFCLKWSAQRDDLSLIPHLSAQEKRVLRREGIETVRSLAALKTLRRPEHPPAVDDAPPTSPHPGAHSSSYALLPMPGQEPLIRRLAATSVGPRLDELIHRGLSYRRYKGDAVDRLMFIPHTGYSSLPYADADQHPNLVCIYLDAQHDYLTDRLYLLGAHIVGYEAGVPSPRRQRDIVHLTDGPPDAVREQRLVWDWVRETIQAAHDVAAPDAEGQARAPIHLIFWSQFERDRLLEGLARHAATIFGATPLYDFVTQVAAFESPLVSYMEREVREHKNYPMLCQSLQSVATFLRFPWNQPQPYRELFYTRHFDVAFKLRDATDESPWYTGRSRFNSQIPLEYAYAAWNTLPRTTGRDDYAPFRRATTALLRGFAMRRLEALEWISRDFKGDPEAEKQPFDLPDLAHFTDKARTLAQALDEFVTIERHVDLAGWKAARSVPAPRRVLMGETLIVRYLEADQAPGVAAQNRENEQRRRLQAQYRQAYFAARPTAKRAMLTQEQKAQSDWNMHAMRLRLRVETADLDCDLDTALGLWTVGEGDRVVVYGLTTVDERQPVEAQVERQPTVRQMLWGMRAYVRRLDVQRDAEGRAQLAWVEVEVDTHSGANTRSFTFGGMPRPLVEGKLYTLDPDPNDIYGYWGYKVVEGLRQIEAGEVQGRHTLYDRLRPRSEAEPRGERLPWPPDAVAAQARFLAGLDAMRDLGEPLTFEDSKRDYIGGCGDEPMLLVQGPPGTGKSFSTAYALLARFQAALATDTDYRLLVACKTHAATDVLIEKLAQAQAGLRRWQARWPEVFARYFDPRLLTIPLYRLAGKDQPPAGVIAVPRDTARPPGDPYSADRLAAARWCGLAATPGAIYNLIKAKWDKAGLFGHYLCDCLVLDEASQMNLPEAMMAALPLKPDGQLIVVGDHRQMPPIVKHNWEEEPRRTFQEYKSYQSLFECLRNLQPRLIQFAESFRLHADMAEYLRREVYAQDGIAYHSRQRAVLPAIPVADDFVRVVLDPQYPLVVVLHDERASQKRNDFERDLMGPVLATLADPQAYALDALAGLGVVVPHRAQRVSLQMAYPVLRQLDPLTGMIRLSAVDTVERFQGGERDAIVVSVTESDPDYLLANRKFVLDPRRLTVAISRAKKKLVLVASRAVFSLFSADEETFQNARLWKNLLRRTCTAPLWAGTLRGYGVEVWGNALTQEPR